jgi:hypothetical protein
MSLSVRTYKPAQLENRGKPQVPLLNPSEGVDGTLIAKRGTEQEG